MFKVPDWGNDIPKSDKELAKLFTKKNKKKTSNSKNIGSIKDIKTNDRRNKIEGIGKVKNKVARKLGIPKKLSKADHIKERMLKRNLIKSISLTKNTDNTEQSYSNCKLVQKYISNAGKNNVNYKENIKNKEKETQKSVILDNFKGIDNKNKKSRKGKQSHSEKTIQDYKNNRIHEQNYNTEEPNKILVNAKTKKLNNKVKNDYIDVIFRCKDTVNEKIKNKQTTDISSNESSIKPSHIVDLDKDNVIEISNKERKLQKKKKQLKKVLEQNRNVIRTNGNKLRIRMMEKLKAAQFRYINEKLYTSTGTESQELFQSNPTAFQAYHEGYQQQIKKWPVNPLDLIIKRIQKMPKTHVIADMGCREAALSKRVEQSVRSFDLVAASPSVEACDMAYTPLPPASVDAVVYCLALMGTDLTLYLLEANRVLKMGGHLLIAEVESRFDNIDTFNSDVQRLGFSLKKMDKGHKVFFFMEFSKVRDAPTKKHKLPVLTLKPCLYKKR